MLMIPENSESGQRDSRMDLPSSKKAARAPGVNKYFTAKPCPKGHLSARLVCDGKCIACKQAYANTIYRDWHRRYYEKNKHKYKKWSAESYERNKSKINKRSTEWQKANPERAREIGAKWRNENREASRKSCRDWAARNPEKRSARDERQRARRRGAEGQFSADDVTRIMKAQKEKCAMPNCRVPLRGKRYHVDHIVPLAQGGTNWPRNIQLLCPSCNMKKGGRDPIAHARSAGFLL